MNAPPRLEFPCDYPLKVVGRPAPGWRERVQALVRRHVPTLAAEHVSERLSANGNFLSLSFQLRAESRTQVEALVAELKALEGVLLLL